MTRAICHPIVLLFYATSTWGAPLTLEQAVTEAKSRGFDAQVAAAAVLEAKGDLQAARALPNPVATVSAGPSLGCFGDGCRAGSPTVSAQLSDQGALFQMFSGKRGLKERAAQAGVKAAVSSQFDVERQLVAMVKQQFVAAIIAEKTTAFSSEVRDSTKRTADLIRERYREGAVDEADVSRVETQQLEAEQALDASQQNLEQQRSSLRFMLGRDASDPGSLELAGQPFLISMPNELLKGASLEELVNKAIEARPDVRAQKAQVEQVEAALASLRRQRVPDISVFVGYSQQGLSPDYSSPPSVTVGLSLPIPLAYRLQGEIAHAEAVVTTERVNLNRARSQARTDVETAWVSYRSQLSQMRRMNNGLLRSAGRARALVSVQYEKGAASLIEFLDAQRTFVAINVEYLSVLQGYWASVFSLEAALAQELSP